MLRQLERFHTANCFVDKLTNISNVHTYSFFAFTIMVFFPSFFYSANIAVGQNKTPSVRACMCPRSVLGSRLRSFDSKHSSGLCIRFSFLVTSVVTSNTFRGRKKSNTEARSISMSG